jgi:hypothetical protein
MAIRDVQMHLRRLCELLKVPTPQQLQTSYVAVSLREIFATGIAYAILKSVEAIFPVHSELAVLQRSQNASTSLSVTTPSLIEEFESKLVDAINAQNAEETAKALFEMGIMGFCPSIGSPPIDRLESSARSVVGRARMIPLIELAYLTEEVGDFKRMAAYSKEACSLEPEAPESHDLYTLKGIIALNSDDLAEAKACLDMSIDICEENELGRIACSIRPFSLRLAEQLLQRGETDAVLRYLVKCKALWTYEKKRLEQWIAALQDGERPNFSVPGIRRSMDEPAVKLRALTIRSSMLNEMWSVEGVRLDGSLPIDLEGLLARHKRNASEAIRGKLKVIKN